MSTIRPTSDCERAALHIGYELTSMVEMAVYLSDTGSALVRNGMLEGTLLHCRNLIGFLWGPHQKDDLRPSDFVTGWDPMGLPVADAERKAIHKHLAHLTWTRVDDGKQQWEFPYVIVNAFAAMQSFVEHCEANGGRYTDTFRAHLDVAQSRMQEARIASESLQYTTAVTSTVLILSDFIELDP